MPLYDYTCSDCGDFRAWRGMSVAHEAVACPSCSQRSRRLLTVTSLGRLSRNTRVAHQYNERSADRPMLASALGRQRPHVHRNGCGHGDQAQHIHGRPWMLGH